MMKTHETLHYPQIGAWRILIEGFREDPVRALEEVVACALILTLTFGALYLKEILFWIKGVLG